MCYGYASTGSTAHARANPGWRAWSQQAPLRYPGSALSWHLYLNNRSSHPETYERKLYRVGPNCEAWPNTLAENPY